MLIKYCQVKIQDTDVTIWKQIHIKKKKTNKKGKFKNKCNYLFYMFGWLGLWMKFLYFLNNISPYRLVL